MFPTKVIGILAIMGVETGLYRHAHHSSASDTGHCELGFLISTDSVLCLSKEGERGRNKAKSVRAIYKQKNKQPIHNRPV